jgi:hypothetical protein
VDGGRKQGCQTYILCTLKLFVSRFHAPDNTWIPLKHYVWLPYLQSVQRGRREILSTRAAICYKRALDVAELFKRGLRRSLAAASISSIQRVFVAFCYHDYLDSSMQTTKLTIFVSRFCLKSPKRELGGYQYSILTNIFLRQSMMVVP